MLKSNASHVFRMSQLTMMYLRYFLVFAWLTNLFVNQMSSTAPAAARQKRIVNVLCDVCGKSFSNTWSYERHRTCTKLKGTSCYSQATQKWSCWQPCVVTWQRPCQCFREVFHMDIEVPPCVVRNRKFAKYVHGLENMYPAHIFCKF